MDAWSQQATPLGVSVLTYTDTSTFTGPDPDPALDADDELAIMAREAGDPHVGRQFVTLEQDGIGEAELGQVVKTHKDIALVTVSTDDGADDVRGDTASSLGTGDDDNFGLRRGSPAIDAADAKRAAAAKR